jgi:hypothetical protein
MAALYYVKFAFFMLLGGLFLLLFWPLGLVFGYFALKALAEAKDAAADILPGDEMISPMAESGRTMEFGPGGPPWGDLEPPVLLDGCVVFVSSIRSIAEVGAVGPQVRVRNGIQTPVPGTERSAYVSVTLHSGDSFSVRGKSADRLRTWFDRVAGTAPALTHH